jgi:hypothetical protein
MCYGPIMIEFMSILLKSWYTNSKYDWLGWSPKFVQKWLLFQWGSTTIIRLNLFYAKWGWWHYHLSVVFLCFSSKYNLLFALHRIVETLWLGLNNNNLLLYNTELGGYDEQTTQWLEFNSRTCILIHVKLYVIVIKFVIVFTASMWCYQSVVVSYANKTDRHDIAEILLKKQIAA